MNILEEIIASKKAEVEERKSLFPVKLLEQSIYFPSDIVSLKKYLLRDDKSRIIAEIKRKSPSRGVINQHVSVERTSIGYMQAGASALSVLTDKSYFGGKNEDLITARKFNFCPILRKDFIIDEYQVVEAKSIGADAILLIAAALEVAQCRKLASLAQALGLEVLLEVHTREEIAAYAQDNIDLVGVNNRDLKTFNTSIDISKELSQYIPSDFIKVSESGIEQPEAILQLRDYGYQGFLIGGYFMAHSRPEKAAEQFIEALTLNRKDYVNN